ncbi:hypothetical protein ACUNV4_02840 [Granulosicoccus sp. 3-233]|uniref:hypothetical protein n=1 Tax=Granulosicoccus sp. 3-233 TaxID=3417969 RepID=UPI003D324D3D
MTHSSVNMEINPNKVWSDMPLGAKIAGGLVAAALMAASLVASVFLAGAALFAALVMVLYGLMTRKGKSGENPVVDGDVRHSSDIRQSDIQQAP